MKRFVNKVLNKLKGDKSQELAEHNHEQSLLAVDTQLMAQRVAATNLKAARKQAEKALENAKYPTSEIAASTEGHEAYMNNILKAKQELARIAKAEKQSEEWSGELVTLRAELDEDDSAETVKE